MSKRLFGFICVFIAVFSLLFGYDEEDDVSSITKIGNVENNIIDVEVSSPVDTLSPAFEFKFGIFASDRFKVGIWGFVYNQLDKTENYFKQSYESASDGSKDYLENEKKLDKYSWSVIDNNLNLVIGYKLFDNFSINFMLGGGSDFDNLSEVKSEYDLTYNSDGTLFSTNPGSDDVKRQSLNTKGFGFIDSGVGFNAKGDFFNVDFIDTFNGFEKFHFVINGNGDNLGLIHLSETGIQSGGFDGNGDTFSGKYVYYQNGQKDKESYTLTHEENFKYFKFSNEGGLEAGLDLHKLIPGLSSLSRFRFTPGLIYRVGFTTFSQPYDKASYEYKSAVLGHIDGDHRYAVTNYKLNYAINVGGQLPLSLDIRPIKSVQFKMGYTLDVDVNLTSYTAQYSEDHKLNDTNASFTDPLISVISNNYNFTHKIGARYRYEFPKIVRFSIGADYKLEHSVSDNKISIPDNKRDYEDGADGEANYDMGDTENYDSSSYPYLSSNINSLVQSVNPYLELDLEVVKDFATITLGWNPVIKWGDAGNSSVADSNLLNLANWSVSNVIKFDNAKTDAINYSAEIKKRDTYDSIVILHSNDTHGHPLAFDNYPQTDIGGLPARATFVNDIRRVYKNVMVLDAGDINTGRPESNFFNAEPDIVGYNYIRYDAMTIGNHEFDIPNAILRKQMGAASFPFLSANIRTKDGKYLGVPYVIKQYGNVKVAVFGLTTKETEVIGTKANIEGLIFDDEVETALKLVPELRKRADIVIALTHMGIYNNNAGSMKLANSVSGIDLIIDGHTHTKMFEPVYVNGIPIVQSWESGMSMGKCVLNLKNKKIAGFSWEAVPINLTRVEKKDNGDKTVVNIGKKYAEDNRLLLKLRPYKEKVENILSEVIGTLPGELSYLNVRKNETEIGNLVGDSMMWYANKNGIKADFAFQNGGGIRASLPGGAVTKKHIYETLPFDNTVVVLSVNGQTIVNMLNYMAALKQGDGAFLQVSKEITFSINYANRQVENVQINGVAVDPSREYLVVTNSYLADGGNGYEMLTKPLSKYDTSKYQRDILIEYFKEIKNVLPVIDHRIKIKSPSAMIRGNGKNLSGSAA